MFRHTTKRPLAAALTLIGGAIAVVAIPILLIASSVNAGGPGIGLGTASSFAVLAGSTITNTGPTTISGDVGLHPGNSVTGFNSVTLNGALHVGDAVAEQAKTDLVTAYNSAAGAGPATEVATDLGGETLTPGVYDSATGTFQITGTVTLDAQGDGNALFVFQMSSTLVTATSSSVNLINGADACNVFWQVGSSATLGVGTSFRGNILALTSITLNTGATIQGRALARNGAVTLDTNTITSTGCAPASTPTPTPSPSPTLPPGGGGTPGPGPTPDNPLPGGSGTPGPTTASETPLNPFNPLGPSGPPESGPPAADSPGPDDDDDSDDDDDTPGSSTTTTTTGRRPLGGVQTGDGSTASAGSDNSLLIGGTLLAAAVATFAFALRITRRGTRS